MTPPQKVATGLVIVFPSARIAGYDALPDPVGGSRGRGAGAGALTAAQGGSLVTLPALAGWPTSPWCT